MDSSESDYPHNTKPTSSHQPHDPQKHSSSSSPSDFLSSAQVVAGAAMSAIRHDSAALDKGRVAGAAADLLHAASHYAHLEDDKRYGTYVQKAEGYLHSYHSSHSTTTTSATAATTTTTAAAHSSSSSAHHHKEEEEEEEEEEGGRASASGIGDYVKLAEGFLKKQGGGHGGGHDSSEGGIGDYMKLAEGFLKKH